MAGMAGVAPGVAPPTTRRGEGESRDGALRRRPRGGERESQTGLDRHKHAKRPPVPLPSAWSAAPRRAQRRQVIPYFKGVASSGKSTIVMRVCRGLYEPADVGVMSNNIERKFGLSALADKLLFVGPEIKGDCQIEQVRAAIRSLLLAAWLVKTRPLAWKLGP